MSFIEQLSKKAGIQLTEVQALNQLQNMSDMYGCCMVEVLPVEKITKIVGLYGNKVNNEHEHWLAKILTIPKKWHISDVFWRTKVRNDSEVEAKFTEGENIVYSEFAGRDIVKTTLQMTFQIQRKGNIDYGYEFMAHHCEPLIDIPFGVGDVIVCPPHVMKKFDNGSRGGIMSEVTEPIPVGLEEIFGYMNGDIFEPFLWVVVKKIQDKVILADSDFKDLSKKHKPYLQYIRGARFLPLEKDCYIFTKYGNDIPQKGSKHPTTIKFIYKHKYHEYDIVQEDETILAYTEKGKWKCAPNVIIGKEVSAKAAMKYLYGHETKFVVETNELKHFEVEGVNGYCIFGRFDCLTYREESMYFCLHRHLIGNIVNDNGNVSISTTPDKVAFDIDLSIHFGKMIPPPYVQEAYEKGTNMLNIDTVVAKNGDGLYFFEKPAYGFIKSGWVIPNKEQFSFWFTQKSRITAIIKDMENIQVLGNRVMVTLIEKEKTDSGIILVGSDKTTDLAEVIEIGDEVKKIQVGQSVIFNKLAMSCPISWKGKTCYFVREGEITAIV